MERLLSQHMGPQGEQNAGNFSNRIDDINGAVQTPAWQSWMWHWHSSFEGLLERFVAAIVVCSQTTKSEKTECSSSTLRLVKLARTVLPLFLFLENGQGFRRVQLNRWPSKDELDSEIPPGEETRYGYIMGMIDTCSL